MAAVELLLQDAVPGRLAGAGGAGQAEHHGTVGQPPKTAALDRRATDFLVGKLTEEFAEALDFLVEQHANGFRRGITSGEACAARRQDDLHGRVRDPLADHGAQLVDVIGHDTLFMQRMASRRQVVDQCVPGAVIFCGACIGDGQYCDGEADLFVIAAHDQSFLPC